MSSRVISPEDSGAIRAIEWRVTGAPLRRPHESTPVPEVQAVELRQESESKIRAAYTQGVAAGEASAQQQAQQKIEPVLKSLNGIIAELSSLRKRTRAEAEEDTMKLAIAIARRVLYRELSTDPDAIVGLVAAAFGKLNARELMRLRVTPTDAATIQNYRAKLQIPAALEIVADGTLPPGSAIFETTRGDLDASVDTQLAEIDRGLTDILKRRK